jgi:sigma-B regulation protein RsbU (phosphoserine phosphatase)
MQETDPGTVLRVDDQPANIVALTEMLRVTGLKILSARGGSEAVQVVASERPDIVLLDISMPPGIDGYETLSRLREMDGARDIPVIFLSSHQDVGSKVRGLELGAVDFIAKPFHAEEVIARVNTHLTIRALRVSLAERNAELERVNRRMKEDLEAAGQVQRALLPASLPEAEGYTFGWAYRPCHELGGDSLDIFRLDDETIGFYLLDVSGHGVPASLLAISATRSLAPRSDRSSLVLDPGWETGPLRIVPPAEVVRRLNLINQLDGDRNPHFITMVYGLLDCRTGVVRYVCAGHPDPIVVTADGSTPPMPKGSVPVGLMPESRFEELEVHLEPGDRMFIHSDGLNEQRNPTRTEFGLDRLQQALVRSCEPVPSAVDGIVARVVEWSGGEVTDDLSILGIGRAA